jgi:hypothetical protein
MSGDWIKIEKSLPRKPEVMELATLLNIDELTVVGHLVLFWSWVDENLSPECPAARGTKTGLDRVVGRDGFVTAMTQVGWLQFEDGMVRIPNYEHHLSQSAKKRALEARKKTRQRKLSRECPPERPAACGTESGTGAGLEKRREEKSITNTVDAGASVPVRKQTRGAFVKPTITDVISYVLEINATVDARAFVDYYESNGWRVGRNPMKDWQSTVRRWNNKNREEINGTKHGNTAAAKENRTASAFDSIRAAAACGSEVSESAE